MKKIRERAKERLPEFSENLHEIKDSDYKENSIPTDPEDETWSENDSIDYINYNKVI